MTDGLGMLDEKRSRRARSIPSSKHPPRSKPVSIVELQPHQDPDPEPSVEAAVAPPQEAPARKPKAPQVVQEPTVKMSIYLEPSDDLYLEEIAYAGKTSRPRVAISRSAIVRLALEQLANTMTTEQIVAELRGRGTQHEGRGRKRR
jgi:hypothetical protein